MKLKNNSTKGQIRIRKYLTIRISVMQFNGNYRLDNSTRECYFNKTMDFNNYPFNS